MTSFMLLSVFWQGDKGVNSVTGAVKSGIETQIKNPQLQVNNRADARGISKSGLDEKRYFVLDKIHSEWPRGILS